VKLEQPGEDPLVDQGSVVGLVRLSVNHGERAGVVLLPQGGRRALTGCARAGYDDVLLSGGHLRLLDDFVGLRLVLIDTGRGYMV